MNDRLFYCDPSSEVGITYPQLEHDVRSIRYVPRFFQPTNYYDLFKTLMAAILGDAEISLVNDELTVPQVSQLLSGLHGEKTDGSEVCISFSLDELTERLRASRGRVGIFTSGTAGRPKLVKHAVSSLMRSVRTSEEHSDDVWGFAYHPTHFAGLQVFFQALFNQNPMVRLFGVETTLAHSIIDDHEITHISSTPTYFRLLCSENRVHNNVRGITLGGEMVSQHVVKQVAVTFPNARIRNIYASTEVGSVLVSDGEEFRVPDDLAGTIKIVDGELAIHRSLLAESMNGNQAEEFYMTGDRVQVTCEQPLTFRIESRRNDLINVGGYKVNPHEIEALVSGLQGVMEARVYGKRNSVTGYIVCCDVVPLPGASLVPRELKAQLRQNLPAYMLPQIITVVPEMRTTATGKKIRSK